MAEPAKPQIPSHPMLVSLTQGGQSPEATTKFAGYVGPPSQKGMVRLYSTLTDLTHYIEFDESAVVQTAEAPESLLPDKALCVWVRASTPVRWVQEYKNASDLEAAIISQLSQSSSSSVSPGPTSVQ
jgi:hypothetical protein